MQEIFLVWPAQKGDSELQVCFDLKEEVKKNGRKVRHLPFSNATFYRRGGEIFLPSFFPFEIESCIYKTVFLFRPNKKYHCLLMSNKLHIFRLLRPLTANCMFSHIHSHLNYYICICDIKPKLCKNIAKGTTDPRVQVYLPK